MKWDTTSRILDPNLIGSSREKACAGFCAGFVSFNIAARIMAMMRLDPRTNAGAAVLFSRSRMAMDLASAAVRDGIKAELEIATALAESLPPVRLGKIEFALTDDFAALIADRKVGKEGVRRVDLGGSRILKKKNIKLTKRRA